MAALSSKNYEKEELIGEGNFGKAWLVRGLSDSKRYVQKEVRVAMLTGRDRQQAMTEVEALARCRYQNVIRYREAFWRDTDSVNQTLCIVMEYADAGDLCQRIASQRGSLLDEKLVFDWFVQICFGLRYIHGLRILHRDLKTSNIFLTAEGIVKIGDFGIARFLVESSDQANTIIGTPYYLSPEICQHKPYDYKSDMWSAGCVLYELCTLSRPFAGSTLTELIVNIIRGNYQPIPKHYSALLEDLVDVLLRPEPSERPTSSEVLSIPLLQPMVEFYVKRSHSRRRTSVPSLDTPPSTSTERRVSESIRQRTPQLVQENECDGKDSPIRVTSSKSINCDEVETKRRRCKENANAHRPGQVRSRHKSCATPASSLDHQVNERVSILSAEPLIKRREAIGAGPKLALYREITQRQCREPAEKVQVLSTQTANKEDKKVQNTITEITSSSCCPSSRQLEISRMLVSGYAPLISSIPSRADSLRCFLRSKFGHDKFRVHHCRIKDLLSASNAPGVVKSTPGVNSPGGLRTVDRMLSVLGVDALESLPLFVQLAQLESLASLA